MAIEVEFVRENAPYRIGDRAAFAEDRANALIAAGAARIAPDVRPVTDAESLPKKTAVVRHHNRKSGG